jgi:hypothetical protein
METAIINIPSVYLQKMIDEWWKNWESTGWETSLIHPEGRIIDLDPPGFIKSILVKLYPLEFDFKTGKWSETSPSFVGKDNIENNFEELQFEKMTGFKTKEELEAYDRGRIEEERMILEWITKWEGSTNSRMGELLYSKLESINKKTGIVESITELLEENKKFRFMIENGLGWKDLNMDDSLPRM